MGWADRAITGLQAGRSVTMRPRGHSMTGRINDGQLVTLAPIAAPLAVGDVVLVSMPHAAGGQVFLHLVKEVAADRVLIGNNRGGINGWAAIDRVHGIVTAVAD